MIIGTDQNLDHHIESSDTIIVYFWADWCQPCKRYSPIIDEINQEKTIPVAKIDVDANPLQTQKYSVSTIPTTILFNQGKEIKRITGASPKHVVLNTFKDWV